MDTLEPIRYRDEFYPVGLRKTLAIMLVTAVTVLPEFFAWANPPATASRATPSMGRSTHSMGRMPGSRFGSSSMRAEPGESSLNSILSILWQVTKTGFVMVVATAGVMLYYPHAGFKRYALLCGPLLAILVPLTLAMYLRGRTEIFRAEILVVSLIAMAPVVALYIFLTWRKAKRLGMDW